MCGSNDTSHDDSQEYSIRMTAHLVKPSSTTSFSVTRVNQTTFRLVEDDRHIERPFIYIKSSPTVMMVIDTGCNAPRYSHLPITALREFLEKVPVQENGQKPLNAHGRLPYAIVLSHCHYDHIGGLATFEGSPHRIYASQALRSKIIDQSLLHSYSLCEACSLPPPALPVDKMTFVADGQYLSWGLGNDRFDLGLQMLHAPGHSPDHLVVFDHAEKTVFLGDLAYEHSPIFYAHGGDLRQHTESLARIEAFLLDLTGAKDTERWIAACGHFTSGVDAIDLLRRTRRFIIDVMTGKVLAQSRIKNNFGEGELDFFTRNEMAMSCPVSILEAANV